MRTAIVFLVAAWAASCAQVREPTGGIKDTQGPRLIEAEPALMSTGFTGDRIVLRFDERVRLDRVRDKLLISPPLAKAPDVRMIGSEAVAIELNAPLEPNTTYLFNIGDAVVDLSEGNTASALQYVISTGGHIDSLQVRGGVISAFTAKPEKDVLLLLYATTNDSGFQRGTPAYFTRSGEDGSFLLGHLRPGSYRLFALRDQNVNYRYDLPNEEIAFHSTFVDASEHDTLTPGITMRLFREAAAAQQVLSSQVTSDGALRVMLARPAKATEIANIDWAGGTLTWIEDANASRDTLLFWPSDTTLLEGRSFQLMEEALVLDTLRYERRMKVPFNLGAAIIRSVTPSGTLFQLRTTRPVRAVDPDRVLLQQGDTTLTITLQLDTGAARTLRLPPMAMMAEGAMLILLPKALTDIYGGTNDTLHLPLRTPVVSETGTVEVKVTAPGPAEGKMLLQMLDAKDHVIREEPAGAGESVVKWSLVPPGAYALKLIADADANGRWTTGSLVPEKEPELAWRYSVDINVRAGWDVRVEWMVKGP